MFKSQIAINIPQWIEEFYLKAKTLENSLDAKMAFTIEIAARNIKENGGPFAAAIFEKDSTNLISLGVNLVTSSKLSIAHAEIVAICAANDSLSTHDLASACKKGVELYSTTQPCAMCMGAIPWAKISKLICAARDSDAREIGFDEGAKPKNWIEEYAKRGISVVCDIQREAAKKVLLEYAKNNGIMY